MASDEICRQLAYHAAGDFANFDVIKLAYSLCNYFEVTTEAAPYVNSQGIRSDATRLSMKIVEESIKVRGGSNYWFQTFLPACAREGKVSLRSRREKKEREFLVLPRHEAGFRHGLAVIADSLTNPPTPSPRNTSGDLLPDVRGRSLAQGRADLQRHPARVQRAGHRQRLRVRL